MSCSGMGRDAYSLTVSFRHFLCRPRRRLSPRGALKDGFGEAVVAREMPEPCEFPPLRLSTVAIRGSWGPTRKLILLYTQLLLLCSKWEVRRSFLRHLVSKAWILVSESASGVMSRRIERNVDKSPLVYNERMISMIKHRTISDSPFTYRYIATKR